MIVTASQNVSQAIYSALRTYYDWIPNQTSQTATKAFFHSVVAVVMLGAMANPAATASALAIEGIRMGLISALAVYIHALTTPFFLALHINEIPFSVEFGRRGVVWYVTSAITCLYSPLQIDLYTTIALTGTHQVLELITNGTWTYPTYEPPIMLPILGTDSNFTPSFPVEWY